MIKQYKDLKYTIKQSKWGIKLDKVDRIPHKDYKLQIKICKTAKKLVFKRYTQYYEYKVLFYDYPRIYLLTFIKLLQPICCDGQIVNDIELEKYNKNFQKRELLPLDSRK